MYIFIITIVEIGAAEEVEVIVLKSNGDEIAGSKISIHQENVLL